jgi:plastocyanin
MRKRLAAVLLLLPLLVAACGGDDDDDGVASGGDDSTDESTGSDAGEADEGGGETLAVTASGFRFDPDALEAGAGEAYTVDFTNEDDTDHTFTIDDLDVDIAAGGGESASGELTADAGEYEFHCRIHSSMKGTLTVS